MKPVTLLFLFAELLDIVTTKVNLRLPGVYEANLFMGGMPEWAWITVKLCVTAIICVLLQRMDFGKLAWLAPALASIPVIYNLGLFLYITIK